MATHILHSFSTANHTIFSMPRGAGFICILYKLLAFSPEFDIIRSWIRKRFKVNNGPVPVLRLRLLGKDGYTMIYSAEVQHMCPVAKGAYHGPAPIPEEGKWVQAKEIKDISGLTHGIGWCAPQQGACKLTLNIKDGIIEEALVETDRKSVGRERVF